MCHATHGKVAREGQSAHRCVPGQSTPAKGLPTEREPTKNPAAKGKSSHREKGNGRAPEGQQTNRDAANANGCDSQTTEREEHAKCKITCGYPCLDRRPLGGRAVKTDVD